MDVSTASLVNMATQRQQDQIAQTAQTLVLKKALEVQSLGAKVLLDALPLATAGSLGTRVNVMA